MANKTKKNVATSKSKATINGNSVSLTEIRRKLKPGEIAKIAHKTGYSESHVSNVLSGRRNNNEILKVAKSLTRRRK